MIASVSLVLLCLASVLLAWIDLRRGLVPDWLNLVIAFVGLARVAALDGSQAAVMAAAKASSSARSCGCCADFTSACASFRAWDLAMSSCWLRQASGSASRCSNATGRRIADCACGGGNPQARRMHDDPPNIAAVRPVSLARTVDRVTAPRKLGCRANARWLSSVVRRPCSRPRAACASPYKDGGIGRKNCRDRLNVYSHLKSADVLAPAGDVKPMVRDALEQGGRYTMICGQSYENKLIKARVESIRKSLTKGGLAVDPDRVQFRDADQIASWVKVLPPVAAWVLEQTQPGIVGPFKDWTHWAGRFERAPQGAIA